MFSHDYDCWHFGFSNKHNWTRFGNFLGVVDISQNYTMPNNYLKMLSISRNIVKNHFRILINQLTPSIKRTTQIDSRTMPNIASFFAILKWIIGWGAPHGLGQKSIASVVAQAAMATAAQRLCCVSDVFLPSLAAVEPQPPACWKKGLTDAYRHARKIMERIGRFIRSALRASVQRF